MFQFLFLRPEDISQVISVGSGLPAKLGSHFILHGISDFLYLCNSQD